MPSPFDTWELKSLLPSKLIATLSVEVIRAFEQKHGLKLPADYVSFLMETGGGVPVDDVTAVGEYGRSLTAFFHLDASHVEDCTGHRAILSAIPQDTKTTFYLVRSLLHSISRMSDLYLPTRYAVENEHASRLVVPFAEEEDGNLYVFDVEDGYRVKVLLHDDTDEFESLADSFSEFYGRIRLDTSDLDDEYDA